MARARKRHVQQSFARYSKKLDKNGQLREQGAALSKRRHTQLNRYSALWDGVFRGGGGQYGRGTHVQ